MVLKQKRLEKGLTQQELMRLSGVPQSIISDIENGATQNPRVETMRRLAAALNCTVDELLQKGRGEKADLAALTRDLEERDRRDRERAVAPLKPAADARLLDTSEMGIDEVVKKVLGWWAELN